MDTPSKTKDRLLLAACAVWTLNGGWLVVCFVLEVSVRMTIGAFIAVGLSSAAVFFIQNTIATNALNASLAGKPAGGSDDDWEKGEA